MSPSSDLCVDSRAIIEEVERCPCLYDKNHPDFKSREVKLGAWLNVCKNVVPHWEKIDPTTQQYIRIEVQTKWRCMKDSFFKSLRRHQQHKGVDVISIRKPYVHHKSMAFLQAFESSEHEGAKESMVNGAKSGEFKDEEQESFIQEVFEAHKACESTIEEHELLDTEVTEMPCTVLQKPDVIPSPKVSRRHRTSKPKVVSGWEYSSPSEQGTRKRQQLPRAPEPMQDPDEMFLMSQLPQIKRMTPEDKLQFQVAFTQLIHKYSNPNSQSGPVLLSQPSTCAKIPEFKLYIV